MENEHNVPLTASELANLWNQYMNDSMSICFIKHSLVHIQDQGIRNVYEYALRLSKSHIEKIEEFLKKEHYPLPIGFTQEDVNVNAPPLFTDSLLSFYMFGMTLMGMTGYAAAVGTSLRTDQRNYFIECNKQASELYSQTVDVMLHKGLLSKPPSIFAPEYPDFVNGNDYLNGWFGTRRPLNAIEINGLSINAQKLMVKIIIEVAFSQVARSNDIIKYFQRGVKICQRHVKIIDRVLANNNLPSPRRWEAEITNSTIAPFSEKLMMFHVIQLVSAAIGFYGAGLSFSHRRDLAAHYTKFSFDMGLFAEDGINMMINRGWMEQPPLANDRRSLANDKKS